MTFLAGYRQHLQNWGLSGYRACERDNFRQQYKYTTSKTDVGCPIHFGKGYILRDIDRNLLILLHRTYHFQDRSSPLSPRPSVGALGPPHNIIGVLSKNSSRAAESRLHIFLYTCCQSPWDFLPLVSNSIPLTSQIGVHQ